MQMIAKIARLSQDHWHCATLKDIFENEFLLKIVGGLSTINWVEAKKSFYSQREQNLRLNIYYQELFSENICNEIIEKMELFFDEKFEFEFDITAHQMLDGDYIGIHTDSNSYGESHRLTLMLNDSWSVDQGGVLLALNGNSLKDIRDAWLPIANTGFVFEISDISYHAVTPIKGSTPRYSIIFTFKKIGEGKDKKSLWSSFPLDTDLEHAISTAGFMGVDSSTFLTKYVTYRFNSIKDFALHIGGKLDNSAEGFSYNNGRSINVDQNGIQSKGSDKERIGLIATLKRIPPIIIVKRKSGRFVLVDGSHRLSYAKDNKTDLCAIIYEESALSSCSF